MTTRAVRKRSALSRWSIVTLLVTSVLNEPTPSGSLQNFDSFYSSTLVEKILALITNRSKNLIMFSTLPFSCFFFSCA